MPFTPPTVVIQNGFDLYGADGAQKLLESYWSSTGANASCSSNAGRRGGGCLQVGDNGTSGISGCWLRRLPAEIETVFLGVAVSAPYCATASTECLRVLSAAAGKQFCVDVTSMGRIRIKTAYNGSVLAESEDGAIAFGVYNYLELKFTCAASGSVQVKVDGVEKIALTSDLNLRQSGSGSCGQIMLGCLNGGSMYSHNTYWDDFYLHSGDGDAPFNDFLGDRRIDGLCFTADGGDADWTSNKASHYDAINDVGSGYATYYNESDAVSERDSYTVALPAGTVTTVTARAHCRNPGGGTAKFKPFMTVDGTRYYGDEVQLPSDTCDLREYTWYSNPAGGAWPATVEIGWETTELS